MLRPILILHRYLGVFLGLVMTVWCLSGFVMMYQGFPALEPKERLRGLEPLPASCCDLTAVPLADETPLSGARLEMTAGRPVLRLSTDDGPQAYLASGEPKHDFSRYEVEAAAAAYARGLGLKATPKRLGPVKLDQWTLQTAKRNQPAYRFDLMDGRGGQIYVSGKTGEVFQDTSAKERILSWLGAIPHWLYPTILRQNGKLWSQVVIWSSTLGTFLVLFGLYVGIARLKRRREGRLSPFRGVWFWHHMTGLAFGVLTLTWTASGLLSMNPWGLLEGGDGAAGGRIEGPMRWGEVRAALTGVQVPAGAVQLRIVMLAGKTYVLATDADGQTARLGGPPSHAEVAGALARAGAPVESLTLLDREDAFYYGHHGKVALPVWRAVLSDAERTRLYIDARTGEITRLVDRDARAYRWLQSGLHDFDWPGLRKRPVWDLVVLPLLAGVTIATVIGTWMGLSRLLRDLCGLGRRFRLSGPGRRSRRAAG